MGCGAQQHILEHNVLFPFIKTKLLELCLVILYTHLHHNMTQTNDTLMQITLENQVC